MSDLGLLDALCRAALAARRCGAAYRVSTRDDALRGLAALTGLADPLGLASGEPQRQPEPDEDRLAEEVVDVADPTA